MCFDLPFNQELPGAIRVKVNDTLGLASAFFSVNFDLRVRRVLLEEIGRYKLDYDVNDLMTAFMSAIADTQLLPEN